MITLVPAGTYVTGSITNCVNYGKISATNSNAYAGGIAGRLIGYPVSLSNCANFGAISQNKAIAGGIIGQVNFSNATDGAIATVLMQEVLLPHTSLVE